MHTPANSAPGSDTSQPASSRKQKANISALDRLCERCGIQAVSEDAFGKEHATSNETKRALLKAMHFAAQTDDEAKSSLEQLERESRGRALPPVLVMYQGSEQNPIPVALDNGPRDLKWRIELEDGEVITGMVGSGDLPLLDRQESADGSRERRKLLLPIDLPCGYHSLHLEGEKSVCSLIVTPGVCWLPSKAAEDGKFCGVAAQLYLLRSAHNWGMGDFTDLRDLVRLCGRRGADVVGINPLHAMFPDDPEQASPYSPSDRLLLNVLYIDVEAVPELAFSEEAQGVLASADFQRQLQTSRSNPLVDYKSVAAMKMPVLQLLFAVFEARQDGDRVASFQAFHAERRELLDRACLFQALRAHFTAGEVNKGDCSLWPAGFGTFASPEVERFAKEHPGLLRFQLWLQWVADEQLRAVKDAAGTMSVGLYRDLAVGAHPSGAEVWSFPEALVAGASVGAPPDIWNPAGQNWGLPPLHPLSAPQTGYRSFIELLQANMRYAGALRIDHALALQRLYWIPEGGEPKDGAYVQYPTEDLVGILALESHRNQCIVIGEDLGTVPKGFRERMADANILSYRVLFFERDEHGFHPPERYPKLSLSVASSHDLPTLRGWWQGNDIDVKERLHLFPDPDGAAKAREQRNKDRDALVTALVGADCVAASEPHSLESFITAAHRFLRATRSLLTLFQLDDLTKEEVQVNIPATADENPNWRRKLALSLEELEAANAMGTNSDFGPVDAAHQDRHIVG